MTLLKAGFVLALLVLANAHAISQQQQKTVGGGGTSQGVRNQRDSELPIAELPIARGRDKREVADTIPNDPTMRWTRCNPVNQSIYDFTLDTLDGRPLTLDKFKGNELLIVNVATFCAYTEHYLDFGPLLDKFQDLRVLAFPCNQFGLQEPGENHEILNGIRYVRPGNNFQLPQNVQMFAKVEVNGQKQNPLFEFLKQSCPPTVLDISKREQIYWNPIRINDITWNFEKFLIDREGIPRFRFHPTAWDKGQLLEQFMAELGGGQQVHGMGSQVVMGQQQQQQGEGEMQ